MPGHRQSALLLHGLEKADQHWVLAQLASDDAGTLRGHLAELKALGIPRDHALAARAQPTGMEEASAGMHVASAEQIQVLLADEPAWLVAHLLAAAEWPWRDEFLASLAPFQRDRIAALRTAPLRPAAARQLVALVASSLPSQRVATPAAGNARSSGLMVLRQTLRRWF
jgi:hypothetical protein